MATKIRSTKDLTSIFKSRIQKALEITQNEIWETIQDHIDAYYNEYDPIKYIRIFKFQTESLIKTKIVKDGCKLYCAIEIDPDYLHYTYPGGHTTGLDVAMLANQHSHGGVYDDDFGCFWDDALEELGMKQGILYIMKSNLNKCGVPVK